MAMSTNAPPDGVPPTVLVVDDDPLVRQVLVRKLRHSGFVVREAADGQEAIELVHCDQPDVVLSDLHMPHCDGERLCQMLKARPTTSEIPVVLMTAGTIDEAVHVEGFDAVLYKPLPPDLPEFLLTLLKSRSAAVERSEASATTVVAASAPTPGDRSLHVVARH
jgi:CheY-like chemotaxis protein